MQNTIRAHIPEHYYYYYFGQCFVIFGKPENISANGVAMSHPFFLFYFDMNRERILKIPSPSSPDNDFFRSKALMMREKPRYKQNNDEKLQTTTEHIL